MLVSAVICSCVQGDGVTGNDLIILSGINGKHLILDSREGVSSKFSFKANYDWSIVDYEGFSCDPSSGKKSYENEVFTVYAAPLKSNDSGDTIRLSSLNFRLKNTRITGLSAVQLPNIIAETRTVKIEAVAGSTATFTFKSKWSKEDIELIPSNENISTKISSPETVSGHFRYTVTVTANKSNLLVEEVPLGHIEFKVNGVIQERLKIEIIQSSAISFDRSSVILPGHIGGENMLTINSKYDISVSHDSDKFSVTPNGNNKQYVVKALVENNSNNDVLLGHIYISLANSPDSCTSIEVYQQRAKASQTIMFYFVGTSLSHYYQNNIEKILVALSADIQYNARILATYTDSSTDATIYELRYDKLKNKGVKEKIQEISLSTPYNSDTFKEVIRNMKEFAPAESYSLVIGSHGHGWTSKYFVATQSTRLQKMGYTMPQQLWQKPEGALTRHIGDGEWSIQYDIEEIATATAANGIKFEYILFDACFMGNIESAYALRNSAKYIIGSTCEIMGAGFPYAKVTKHMLTDKGKSYNLDSICKEFVNHYKTDSSVGVRSACVSLTHTEELEALAQAMKRVNNAGVKADFSLENVQYYDGKSSNHNPVRIFYDLGDMVEQSCADSNAMTAFKEQLKRSVTSLYHTDTFYSAYDGAHHKINKFTGTTTSAMVHYCSEEWEKTEWYKDTH